jgi:hypothetical protein
MARHGILVALGLGVALCAPAIARADTAVVRDDVEVTVGGGPHQRSGLEETIHVGRFERHSHASREQHGRKPRRGGQEDLALLRFDLGGIPPGTEITASTLRVWVSDVDEPGALEIRPVLGPWREQHLRGSSLPPLGEVLATVEVGKDHEGHFLLVDVTSLTAEWLAGGANEGLALVPAPTGRLRMAIDSKENEETSHAPELALLLGTLAGGEGPEGPAGPPGPAGPQGPPGILGYEIVTADSSPASLEATALAACPPEKVTIGGGATILAEPALPSSIPGVQVTPDPTSNAAWDVSLDATFDSILASGHSAGTSQTNTGVEGSFVVDLTIDFAGGAPSVTEVRVVSGELRTSEDVVLDLDQGNITGQVTGRPRLRLAAAPIPVSAGAFVAESVVDVPDPSLSLSSSNPLFELVIAAIQGLMGDFLAQHVQVPVTFPASVDVRQTSAGPPGQYDVRFSLLGTGSATPSWSGSDTYPVLGDTTYGFSAAASGQIALQLTGAFVRNQPPRAEDVVAVQQSFPIVEGDAATGWQARAREITPTDEVWRLRVHAICVERP